MAHNIWVEKLKKMADLNQSGVGSLLLINTFKQDLIHANKYFDFDQDVVDAIEAGVRELHTNDLKKALNLDAASIKSIKNDRLKILTKQPSTDYQDATSFKIRAIRGATVYYYLVNNKKITNKLLSEFSSIFDAKDPEDAVKFETLEFSKVAIAELIEQDAKHREIYSVLIKLWEMHLKSHRNHVLGQVSNVKIVDIKIPPVIDQTNISSNSQETNADLTDVKTNESNISKDQPNDLLRWKLKGYSKQPRVAGACNLNRHLHPVESEIFYRKVTENYKKGLNEVELALFISFIIGVTTTHFHFVSIGRHLNKNLWLELDDGFIAYDRNFLIGNESSQEEKDIFLIPLPLEIVRALKQLKAENKNAQNLAEIFKTPMLMLGRKITDYCNKNSLTSKLITPTKIEISYSRFLLEICGDELYSATISADFSITDRANANYFLAIASQINSICIRSYQKLGLSGKLFKLVTNDIGSEHATQADEIFTIIKDELHQANRAFKTLTTRNDDKKLIHVHEVIAKAILLLCTFCCGLRASNEGYFAAHQLDLQNRLLLITDKKTTPYTTWRVIPICDVLYEWLDFYYSFLKKLARELDNKKITEQIFALAHSNGVAPIPLFFRINSNNTIVPLCTQDLSASFSSLPSNIGRHVLDNLLREKIGNLLINTLMGRAQSGQEALGDRSCLSADHAYKKIRDAINTALSTAEFPNPLRISTPREKHFISEITIPYRTALALKRDTQKSEKNTYQDCPFDEFTLLHSKFFNLVADQWKRNPVRAEFIDLMLSLIINDGVCLFDELLEAIVEISDGKIYIINHMHAIDTCSKSLGLRRLFLSDETILIANQTLGQISLAEENQLAYLIREKFKTRIADFYELNFMLDPNLDSFLNAAKAAFSITLPGVVRAWFNGIFSGRTRRIESITRELTGNPEPQISDKVRKPSGQKIDTDAEVMQIIHKFSSKKQNLGSNQKRMRNMVDELVKVMPLLTLAEDQLLAEFAIFLAGEKTAIESVSTLQNYYYVARNLVGRLPSTIFNQDIIDLPKLLIFLKDQALNNTEISAYNYFLKMIGASIKLKATINRVKPYVEYFSCNDVDQIKQKLKNTYDNSPIFGLQANAMLEILSSGAIRAEDVSKVRLCDVYVGDQSHIYYTHKVVGTKKTRNADRIIFQKNYDWSNLKKLVELKRSTYPDKPEAYLFSLGESPYDLEYAFYLLDRVSSATKLSTGSPYARPHVTRHTYISNEINHACLIESQSKYTPLALRLYLPETSIDAGHGDEKVTIEEYSNSMPDLRRLWLDHLKRAAGANHIASLLGQHKDHIVRLLKQKRYDDILYLQIKKIHQNSKLNFIQVNQEFLTTSNSVTTFDVNKNEEIYGVAFSKFILLTAIDQDEELARISCDLNTDTFNHFMNGFNKLNTIAHKKWKVTIKSTPSLILEQKLLIPIQQQFNPIGFTYDDIFGLLDCFPEEINNPWLCNIRQLQTLNAKLISRIKNLGYEAVLFVPQNEAPDSYLLYSSEFTSIETQSSLKSTHKNKYKVSFYPTGTELAARPKKLGPAMMFVTAGLFSIFCNYLGKIKNV